MNHILILLKPRIWPLANRSTRTKARSGLKLFFFGTIGVLFSYNFV